MCGQANVNHTLFRQMDYIHFNIMPKKTLLRQHDKMPMRTSRQEYVRVSHYVRPYPAEKQLSKCFSQKDTSYE